MDIDDVAAGIAAQVAAAYGDDSFEVVRRELVGPKIGRELEQRAGLAIMFSLVLTLLYIAIRFEMRFGVASVIATAHDMLITLGLLALFRVEISLPTVAAILTILGYSLNDTIVVFDRIRENLNRKGGRREDPYKLVNRSINETLPRTVLTSGTTLAVLLSLLVLGGGVIRPFTMVLILGVLIGTYVSSSSSPRRRCWRSRGGTGPARTRRSSVPRGGPRRCSSPWTESPRHSNGDASAPDRWRSALLLGPVALLLALRRALPAGASPLSVLGRPCPRTANGVRFADSHCHLTDRAFGADRAAVLARAREAGVRRVVTIASDADDSLAALELARAHDDVWCTAGIHPHAVGGSGASPTMDALRDVAGHPRCVAIGETGLDYFYDNAPRDAQRRSFARHVELAAELDLPVVVHSREAEADTAAVVRESAGQVTGVLHCFTGSRELLAEAMAAGWFVSFTGIATFKNFDAGLVRQARPTAT